MSARDESHAVVTIQAEIADGSIREWTDAAALGAPLSIFIHRWADRVGVPLSACGCELTATETILDLGKTPADLGWKHGDTIHVIVFPVDLTLAEADPSGPAEQSASQASGLSGSAPAPVGRPRLALSTACRRHLQAAGVRLHDGCPTPDKRQRRGDQGRALERDEERRAEEAAAVAAADGPPLEDDHDQWGVLEERLAALPARDKEKNVWFWKTFWTARVAARKANEKRLADTIEIDLSDL